ncbi:MAG: hypothetical protein K9M81_01665 [Chthoniobacterales bacterium]|nr:hypothetical protein [Chthoniobacterales bacterium]
MRKKLDLKLVAMKPRLKAVYHAVSHAVSRPPVVPYQLSRPPRHDQYEI